MKKLSMQREKKKKVKNKFNKALALNLLFLLLFQRNVFLDFSHLICKGLLGLVQGDMYHEFLRVHLFNFSTQTKSFQHPLNVHHYSD